MIRGEDGDFKIIRRKEVQKQRSKRIMVEDLNRAIKVEGRALRAHSLLSEISSHSSLSSKESISSISSSLKIDRVEAQIEVDTNVMEPEAPVLTKKLRRKTLKFVTKAD
jgi:hypothetical protein